jgi:hypothetical protein
MVIFTYLGNLKPMPAGQENVFADLSVLLVHDSESAKTFPCPAGFPSKDIKW